MRMRPKEYFASGLCVLERDGPHQPARLHCTVPGEQNGETMAIRIASALNCRAAAEAFDGIDYAADPVGEP